MACIEKHCASLPRHTAIYKCPVCSVPKTLIQTSILPPTNNVSLLAKNVRHVLGNSSWASHAIIETPHSSTSGIAPTSLVRSKSATIVQMDPDDASYKLLKSQSGGFDVKSFFSTGRFTIRRVLFYAVAVLSLIVLLDVFVYGRPAGLGPKIQRESTIAKPVIGKYASNENHGK